MTTHRDGSPGPAPSAEHLLVLYFASAAEAEAVARRVGGPVVEAENPYWTDNGAITIEDPDGWRVVLMRRPTAPADPDRPGGCPP